MAQKLIIFILIIVAGMAIQSCTNANKSEDNLKKLDAVYGYCDNPQRGIFGRQYEICKAKEMAAGPGGEVKDPKSFSEILGSLTGNQSDKNYLYINSVNKSLWLAATDVLSGYPTKIANSEIGFIETDWIYNKEEVDKRCLIKVQIKSSELVSTGVDVFFLCQSKIEGEWYSDNQNYDLERKQLVLQILSKAQEFKNQN